MTPCVQPSIGAHSHPGAMTTNGQTGSSAFSDDGSRMTAARGAPGERHDP
ncbi:hypothetical protein [Cyanobium sp. Morenito 9A2]|nr:hypothetical protein [Cyanobium sp. Morenito 9A2]MCP9848616.1 hypothetical protein [Cyanobium sp. Morenito 9A2]